MLVAVPPLSSRVLHCELTNQTDIRRRQRSLDGLTCQIDSSIEYGAQFVHDGITDALVGSRHLGMKIRTWSEKGTSSGTYHGYFARHKNVFVDA